MLTFGFSELFASPQLSDYIIYKKDTIATYNLILEQYLQKQDTTAKEKLFGLTFRAGASFNCWRGYQAIYKIQNDSLFLTEILNCGDLRSGMIDKSGSHKKMKAIFGKNLINEKVYVGWFIGDISFPLKNKVLRDDGVFYRIFEQEKVISIKNGIVDTIKDVENYVDDPKSINRRDKNKITNTLFRKLKKAKWKNSNKFDCSAKYIITIDENGNISKVRMANSDEEIAQQYEVKELDFCIKNIYESLKPLKFDIIKDKGKPIAEDIYLEIWVEDNGKIENWT